jgi:quercetin dioxygenase-like cupin family protein
MVVTPLQGARFVPTDPRRPDGTRLAVLWGDPAKGPSAILLELKKGGGRLHVHSSDYHLVLLEGAMKHLGEGERESEVKPLDLGSYWFQPGNQPHSDICLTDKCLMFIKWEGKRDSKPVERPTE